MASSTGLDSRHHQAAPYLHRHIVAQYLTTTYCLFHHSTVLILASLIECIDDGMDMVSGMLLQVVK
jgi:hypothetical protein